VAASIQSYGYSSQYAANRKSYKLKLGKAEHKWKLGSVIK